MIDSIIARSTAKGLRLTDHRRTIARMIEQADDHPDGKELRIRATVIDPHISNATVYRAVKLFEKAGRLDKLKFSVCRARFEDAEPEHHNHLIDTNTGEVIEFVDPEIEELQDRIATRPGYRLKGHRLELFGVPLKKGG